MHNIKLGKRKDYYNKGGGFAEGGRQSDLMV